MARMTRKELLKQDEFVETAQDFGHWMEENWRAAAKWAAAVVVLAVIAMASVAWYRHRIESAQELLARGIGRYAAAEASGFADRGELEQTLALFDEVIGKAGGTPAGKVARFYSGATLYRLGRRDEAIPLIETVASLDGPSATLVGAAQALLAKLLVEAGEVERAIRLLEELSAEEEGGYPADQALLLLGRIHRSQGNEQAARDAFQAIADRFPGSASATEASRLLARP